MPRNNNHSQKGKGDKMKRIFVALMTVIMLVGLMAIPTQAAYHAELGEYVSEIEIGEEYVLESVKFPGLVATPDTRPDYTDWLTLTKFYSASPREAHQLWHFTNWDEHTGTRSGYVQLSNHIKSYGSGTLRLITYTPNGFYWLKDRYGDESQWFKPVKAYVKNGRQVWRFYHTASGCKLSPGGWTDYYLRKVNHIDPAQG